MTAPCRSLKDTQEKQELGEREKEMRLRIRVMEKVEKRERLTVSSNE